jgi:hypothetical protein
MNEHKIAEKIDHAAMELLKDPGIKLDHDEICKMLLDAGATEGVSANVQVTFSVDAASTLTTCIDTIKPSIKPKFPKILQNLSFSLPLLLSEIIYRE